MRYCVMVYKIYCITEDDVLIFISCAGVVFYQHFVIYDLCVEDNFNKTKFDVIYFYEVVITKLRVGQ